MVVLVGFAFSKLEMTNAIAKGHRKMGELDTLLLPLPQHEN